MADLRSEFLGIKSPNPFWLASAPPTDKEYNVVRAFKGHLTRAGLPDVRFHDLRHSCASLLVAQRVHAREVMEILGHSNFNITMTLYSHLMPQALREAVSLMDGLFASG